eukprot:TRINITY_DN43265_c0_g1_i1.p1 TRINITY_DN43265_c0_g1~~TRINITY_DN43265_c0_g1_i1.p1  ORF type:complete len:981 (+),score=311.23 TRINITY_DN43265_c0_g1_i1:54-2945(+)
MEAPAAEPAPEAAPAPAVPYPTDPDASFDGAVWEVQPADVPKAPAARATPRGCVRGEVLWYRPEWERPWRTRKQQRGADAIATKEAEVEVQIERNTALRRQLHQARLELKRAAQASQRREAEFAEEMRRTEDRLQQRADAALADGQAAVNKLEHRIEALQRAHEEQATALHRRIAAEEERCSRAESDGRRQVVNQTVAHDEQVAQLRRLLAIKDAEIVSLEQRGGVRLQHAAEERDRETGSIRQQMAEAERKYQEVIDEQHKRSEQQLDQALRQSQSLRQELDESKSQCEAQAARIRVLEQGMRDCEQDRDRWTRRVGAEVGGVAELLGGTSAASDVAEAAKKESAPLDAYVWRKVSELRSLVESHRGELTSARKRGDEAWREREGAARVERDRWAERDRHLSEVAAEADRIRLTQAKLQRAIRQAESIAVPLREQSAALVDRLRFFTEDHREAEGQMAALAASGLPPPQEDAHLTIVALAVSEAAALRCAAPEAIDVALGVCRDAIRQKAKQHSGHEALSTSEGWIFLFRHAADGVSFALSVQVALVHAPWPHQILALPACAATGAADGTGTLWRGLRVRCGVGHGLVKVSDRRCGTTTAGHLVPEARRYHGEAVREALCVLSLAAAGQVLLTDSARASVVPRGDELPPHTTADTGVHRLIQTPSTPKVRLWDLRPTLLSARGLPPVPDAAAAVPPGLPSGLLDALSGETDSLARGREVLGGALSALTQEADETGAASVRLAARVRELRNAKPWQPDDLVPVLGELDQLVLRQETSRQQLNDAFRNQDTLLRELRHLEHSVAAHSHALLTDSDCRRLLAVREHQLKDEMQEMEEAHLARQDHLHATALRKDSAISGLKAERAAAGGMVDALQRELDLERRAHVDATHHAESRIGELERRVARERALNPSRRFDRVPQCADHRPARGSAAWSRSPRTPGATSVVSAGRSGAGEIVAPPRSAAW